MYKILQSSPKQHQLKDKKNNNYSGYISGL